jgi:hypothetical protein
MQGRGIIVDLHDAVTRADGHRGVRVSSQGAYIVAVTGYLRTQQALIVTL